jgi:hypothetical protein
MVDDTELQNLMQGLMREHDALLQEREVVRQEEERIKTRREELDRKLTGLKQSLQGLSLYSTARDQPTSLTKETRSLAQTLKAWEISDAPTITAKTLTECCRDILARNGEWMTALQVRQGLHAAGFDFSGYTSNPLSSIHTTLKRIAESGQAWTQCEISTNDTLYRWKKEGENAAPLGEIAAKSPPQNALRIRPPASRPTYPVRPPSRGRVVSPIPEPPDAQTETGQK